MVTPIYTPLINPYRPRANRPVGAEEDGDANPKQFQVNPDDQRQAPQHEELPNIPRPSTPPVGFVGQGPAIQRPLASIQDQRMGQKIQLDSILDDFSNTLNALGANDDLRNEVAAYLHVAKIQGSKDNPEVGYVKHSLRTAANAMDKFITGALGEKSTVVKDWVDALLLQNIEYKTDSKPTAVVPLPGTDETPIAVEAKPFDELDRQRLKTLVNDSRTMAEEGRHDDAQGLLDEGLELLNGRERPDLEARVLHVKGRIYDEAKEPELALRHYEQAESRFGITGQTRKQAQTLYAMGSILDEQGDLDQAARFYERVSALDEEHGDTASLARTLNDLGGVYLRNHAGGMAVETFRQACKHAQTAAPELLPDTMSNLGTALRSEGDYEMAAKAYQRSLKLAKQNRDKDGYINTLENLASLYVESGQDELAARVQDKLAMLA